MSIRVHYFLLYLPSPRGLLARSLAIPLPGPVLFATLIIAALPVGASPPASLAANYRISPVADPPAWSYLDAFQFTMTRDEFKKALTTCYCEGPAWKTTIALHADHADIQRSTLRPEWPPYRLNFASGNREKRPPPGNQRYWRPSSSLRKPGTPQAPLEGLKIAIDPGHLGGAWAKMEGRWFRIGNSKPILEGELTLEVATRLVPRLTALGATVSLVREGPEPITSSRPADFVDEAEKQLRLQGVINPAPSYENLPAGSSRKAFTLQYLSELYFYRAREIRDRALLVNQTLQPDLVLCIHFNAEAWGNPDRPTFVPNNHLHVLSNGAYSAGELASDDIRFEMLQRLVQRIHEEEVPLCDTVARAMAEVTGLPPYIYPGGNATRINGNPYLFARNLLANRVYLCPVIFLEPYVMNNREVFNRVQRADAEDPDIFDEYVEGIVSGLENYYSTRRALHP